MWCKNEITKHATGQVKCLSASTGVCCCASTPVQIVNKQGSSSCWRRIASKASAPDQLLKASAQVLLMSLRATISILPERPRNSCRCGSAGSDVSRNAMIIKDLQLTSGSRPVKPRYAMLAQNWPFPSPLGQVIDGMWAGRKPIRDRGLTTTLHVPAENWQRLAGSGARTSEAGNHGTDEPVILWVVFQKWSGTVTICGQRICCIKTRN